jgi:hypothetical protein
VSKNQNRNPRQQRNADRKRRFLAELAKTSNVARSAKKAHVGVSTVYDWRAKDPVFRGDWMEALAAGYELLEMEMLQRAREGVDRKIFYGGKEVDTIRHYDNRTALKLLSAHKAMVAITRAAQACLQEEHGNAADRLDRKLHELRARLASGNSDFDTVFRRSAGERPEASR